MIIRCPKCASRYKIDPAATDKPRVNVKCPGCRHLFQVDLSSIEKDAGPLPTDSADDKPRVLVVDDARFFREMIQDILSTLPVDLKSAVDAEEAWHLLQQWKPQLLLLDLNIPGRSGYELLGDIQQAPAFAEMKILVMSGVQRGEEVSARVSRLGADEFLGKSFTPKELQDRVRRILSL